MADILNNQTAKQRAIDGTHTGTLNGAVSGAPAGTSVSLTFASASSSTAASAGTATALPATPAGYFYAIGPNNTVVKIPYYNV